ncbi:PdaC/SigV domain-containing protein [Saccharibacillus sacchari]|uniref:PdaC/SigV domain-containing protein n=1 Tax=Saccharibacillus sacchari TaxID=456493 RepID=UPI0004AF985A|nr:DUF4163 domain-containing protein [Saccharibacillus sacchari]
MNATVKRVNKFNLLSAIVLSTGIAAGMTAIVPSSTIYAAASTTAAQTHSNVQVEGHTVKTDAGRNGSLLIPIKDAAKAAGIKVSVNPKTKAMTLTQAANRAVFEMDSDSVVVKLNGSSIGDRYEAQKIGGVDYVDAQAFAVPFGYQVRVERESGAVLIDRNEANEITVTAAKLQTPLSKGSTTINIVYPIVSGLGNAKNEQAINAALKAHAQQFLNTAKSQIGKSHGPAKGETYEFYSTYKITYNQNGYLSFMLDDYTSLGGAHGKSAKTGMTFTLGNGKAAKFTQLAKDEKNAEKIVKKMIEGQIRTDAGSKSYTLQDFRKWTQGTKSFTDNFCMTYDGVTILVPLNNTAPSALNVLEFQLPGLHLLKSDLQ